MNPLTPEAFTAEELNEIMSGLSLLHSTQSLRQENDKTERDDCMNPNRAAIFNQRIASRETILLNIETTASKITKAINQ